MENEIKVNVLHDKIVVRRVNPEVQTEAGIILGEIEKDQDTGYGQVVAVGGGKQIDGTGIIPTKTKVGDVITFNYRVPRRVSFKGEYLWILRESDVDFIVEDSGITFKSLVTEGEEYSSPGNVRNIASM